MHDPIYKRLFAFPRMVADLLRAVGEPDWIDAIDFDTLEELPPSTSATGGRSGAAMRSGGCASGVAGSTSWCCWSFNPRAM